MHIINIKQGGFKSHRPWILYTCKLPSVDYSSSCPRPRPRRKHTTSQEDTISYLFKAKEGLLRKYGNLPHTLWNLCILQIDPGTFIAVYIHRRLGAEIQYPPPLSNSHPPNVPQLSELIVLSW
ncbi:hypothetical protein MLD38_008105 [Melastoma candidum]|uniref:Uncharacterized protein n=1 Tax=Melastoma candidum TaxID=119954 RepID=A0ACB9RTS2_9MYRT|nr:hypothetical protein MLD38_008105 [Melastoma candidum]